MGLLWRNLWLLSLKKNNNKEIVRGKTGQDWLQSSCFFLLEVSPA